MDIQRVKELLTPALERADEVSWEWLLEGIANGDIQLWMGKESALTTRIIYGLHTELQWLMVGGKLNEVLEMVPKIEDWARSMNCRKARFVGRKGWAKVLTNLNYKIKPQVSMTKEL